MSRVQISTTGLDVERTTAKMEAAGLIVAPVPFNSDSLLVTGDEAKSGSSLRKYYVRKDGTAVVPDGTVTKPEPTTDGTVAPDYSLEALLTRAGDQTRATYEQIESAEAKQSYASQLRAHFEKIDADAAKDAE